MDVPRTCAGNVLPFLIGLGLVLGLEDDWFSPAGTS